MILPHYYGQRGQPDVRPGVVDVAANASPGEESEDEEESEEEEDEEEEEELEIPAEARVIGDAPTIERVDYRKRPPTQTFAIR